MAEKTIDVLIEENANLMKSVLQAEGLLKACMPYIEMQFDRARFRQPHKELLEAIKRFIGEI